MGGHFWSYCVPYQEDIEAALKALREREFRAGRFWQPAEVQPGFFGRLLGRGSSKPKRPASIREALKIAGFTGTRSILDIERVADAPEAGAVAPVRPEDLLDFFGTDHPTLQAIEKCDDLFNALEGGQGIYAVLYREGEPETIYFAGYSYD